MLNCRERKRLVAWQYCYPKSFCNPESFLARTFQKVWIVFQKTWTIFRQSGQFLNRLHNFFLQSCKSLDNLAGFQTFHVSRKFCKFPDSWIFFFQKVFKFPECLKSFQTALKVSIQCEQFLTVSKFPESQKTSRNTLESFWKVANVSSRLRNIFPDRLKSFRLVYCFQTISKFPESLDVSSRCRQT